MLQFFSASTNIVNSKRAITECLENALQGEPDINCDLIIIYTAMGHNFKDLLTEAHKLSPGAQIVGCTAGGIIGKEGPDESMKALAIMAIKGQQSEFAVSVLDSTDYTDTYAYSYKLSQELKSKNPDINLILVDPSFKRFINSIDKFIAGIEAVFGSNVKIIGGLSFDGRMVADFQFIDDRILENSAIMVGFADSTLEVITWANHGLEVVGFPLEVTKCDQNNIIELDGRKTWEILMKKLGLPESTSPSIEISIISSLAVGLPEEYQKEYGSEYTVIGALVPDTKGVITGLYPIPSGTKVWLTRRNEQKIFDGVDLMTGKINEHLEGKVPVAVFHADCQARGKLLFNKIMKEEIITRLQFPVFKGENIPWLGMYGGGEITPMGGKNMIHVFTSSLYVLVRNK
jgi:small ligand-binding sensory domain FIST